MAAKRKLDNTLSEEEDPVDPSDELLFIALGGGNEVGRSCHIIQYKGKTVMVRLAILRLRREAKCLSSLMQAYIQRTTGLPRFPSTMISISVL